MADRFIRGCTSLPRGVEVEKGEGREEKGGGGRVRDGEKETEGTSDENVVVVARTRLARIPEVTVGITFR